MLRLLRVIVPLAGLAASLTGCATSLTFAPGVAVYPVGSRPVAVAIGDVNGDGRPDVVTANAGNDTVTVLLQGPHGRFDARWTLALPAGADPSALAVAHFTSRRRASIVVAEKGKDALAVFTRPANGRGPDRTLPLGKGAAPSALASADLNGDGFADLGVGVHATEPGCAVPGCVVLFDGGRTGLREQRTAVPLGDDPSSSYDPAALAFVDLGHDGTLDLAVGDAAAGRVLVVPATGPGTFSSDPAAFPSVAYEDPTQLVTGPLGTGPAPDGLVVGGSHCSRATLSGSQLALQPLPLPGTLCFAAPGARTVAGSLAPATGAVRVVASGAGELLRFSSPKLAGAAAIATGRLLPTWTRDAADAAVALPSRNAVAVVQTYATWSSSTTRLRFGKVPVGERASLSFQGTLGGAAGGYPVQAGVAGAHAFSLAAQHCTGSTCTFTVTFAPTSSGNQTAHLVLAAPETVPDVPAAAMAGGPVEISLSGRGVGRTASQKAAAKRTADPRAHTARSAGKAALASIVDPVPGDGSEAAPLPFGVPYQLGVTDDTGKFSDDGGASFYADVRDLHLSLTRETVLWHGEASIDSSPDRAFLDRSLPVAKADGVQIILSIYPATPTEHDPQSFCAFAESVVQRYTDPQYGPVDEYVIGNEPNQDAFWQPQVDASGASLSAPAYEQLLSTCYRLIKPRFPQVTLAGAAINSNGTDSDGKHPSTSPARFIEGMAAAYERNHESGPIMDVFAFHPYPIVNRFRVYGPAFGYRYPNATIPDLARIRYVFDHAFAGTGQPLFRDGLKFLIDEVGWQTTIPPEHLGAYAGTENAKVVDLQTQASYYTRLIEGYACDGSVTQLLLYHLVDEPQLNSAPGSGGWQSGLEYVDRAHKPSFDAVGAVAARNRLALCDTNAFAKPARP